MIFMNIRNNIESIKSEIGNVLLVAVSKTKGNEEILEAYNNGIKDFGENYVQELIVKMDSLPKDIRWHMIGHLQTNKVKDIVKRNIFLIESVDSYKLACTINKEAIKNDKIVNILIEVKMSNIDSRSGCSINELSTLICEIKKLSNINVLGLMVVAPLISNEEEIRSCFKTMKSLKEKYKLKELSMGMSNDYKIAIEEGSTMLRIGTNIFGKRKNMI